MQKDHPPKANTGNKSTEVQEKLATIHSMAGDTPAISISTQGTKKVFLFAIVQRIATQIARPKYAAF
jgi:hypothetical protein